MGTPAERGDQFFGTYRVVAFESSFVSSRRTYVSGGSYRTEYISETVVQDKVGAIDNCSLDRQERYSEFTRDKTINSRTSCELVGKSFNILSNLGSDGTCKLIQLPALGSLMILEDIRIPGCFTENKNFGYESSTNYYRISYSEPYVPSRYISLVQNSNGTITFVKGEVYRNSSADGSSFGTTWKETFTLEKL
jgi:hypothetical protein